MINETDYGRALFELAREQQADKAVLEELAAVRRILEQEPRYAELLDSPALPKEQRLSLLEKAFGGLSQYHLNFLKILCEKHAVKQYAGCARVYGDLYDEAHQILRATAITAVPMTQAQLSALTDKLRAMTGKTVVVKNTVDARVVGGVQLRLGGIQLDGSIRSRLEDLRRSLAGVIV